MRPFGGPAVQIGTKQAHPQRPRFPSHNSRLIQSRAAERGRQVREIILWGCQYQRAQMELPVSCSPSRVRRETPDPSVRGARRPPGDPRPPPGFWGRDRCGTADPRRAPSPDPSARSLGQGPRPGTVSSGSARPLPACFAQSPGRLPAERRAAGGGARRGAKRGCRVARAGGGFGGGGVGSGPGLRPARRLLQAARSGRCHPAAACSTVAAR